MWLIAVPGLLFGTIGVLAPLRLDELGAGAGVIGAAWLAAAALESCVSPIVGRVSDRRGRLFPCMLGLAGGAVVMLLFPWPDRIWQVAALVILAAPTVGMLWAPSLALLSDGAEAVGIAQGFAFAFSNLGWSIGQTAGSAASARLADATSDAVPYLILSGVCLATLASSPARAARSRASRDHARPAGRPAPRPLADAAPRPYWLDHRDARRLARRSTARSRPTSSWSAAG